MINKYVTNQGQGCSFLALLLYLLFAVYSPVVFSSEKTDSPEISAGQNEIEAQLESMKRFASEHRDKVYACPMHPNEVSDKPGSCFICGMFLVAQETDSSGIDNVKHNHTSVTGSDESVETKAGIRHEHKAVDQKSKPALFWESTEPRAISNSEHKESVPDYENQPVTQRLHPEELPGVADTAAKNMTESPEEHARKHQDSTYICPMHPQIMQNEPGNCPICGMNLVPQREFSTRR